MKLITKKLILLFILLVGELYLIVTISNGLYQLIIMFFILMTSFFIGKIQTLKELLENPSESYSQAKNLR